MRAPLLFGEQAGILYRDRNLASRSPHDFQVARFESVLTLHAHGGHNASRFAAEQNRSSAEALGGSSGNKSHTQVFAGFLYIGP